MLMVVSEALAETLCMVSQAALDAADDWWIIGSAAVVLHGGDVPDVKDVDLMMSVCDADAFLSRVGGERGGAETSKLFRSEVFGIWNEPPIPVEVFGGFGVATAGGWRELSLSTRQPVVVEGSRVHVPSAEELVRLLNLFGRPKDLQRARLLRT